MIALAADENFNNDILRALIRHRPEIDVLRVQDAGLSGAEDPQILAWAAGEGRLLLTHDAATMPRFAYDRIEAGLPVAGVLLVNRKLRLRDVIDELLLIAEVSVPADWSNRVRYLPL